MSRRLSLKDDRLFVKSPGRDSGKETKKDSGKDESGGGGGKSSDGDGGGKSSDGGGGGGKSSSGGGSRKSSGKKKSRQEGDERGRVRRCIHYYLNRDPVCEPICCIMPCAIL